MNFFFPFKKNHEVSHSLKNKNEVLFQEKKRTVVSSSLEEIKLVSASSEF